MPTIPNLAFYYPNPIWARPDRIKNLLLFFDGVALLVPSYMKDKPFQADPLLAPELRERGLLRILEPETFMTAEATRALADAMKPILDSGALDSLVSQPSQFHELSYSRLGFMADADVAQGLLDALLAKGLVKKTMDGVSIPMHPIARSMILVLLAQLLRPAGKLQGIELSPATDRPEVHIALREILGLPRAESAAHVVSLDLQTVGVDLSEIPLDEVLAFRREHGKTFRKYAKALRNFVRDSRHATREERVAALRERRTEIKDLAASARAISRKAWRKQLSLGLGIAGAAWKAHTGDLLGALLAFGAGVAGAEAQGPVDTGAYSYVFAAKDKFA